MLENSPSQRCTTCGLQLVGAVCAACGGNGRPISLADGDAASSSAYASEATRPELDLAQDAKQSGDHGRMVTHCLAALGIRDARTQSGADGTSLRAAAGGFVAFLRVRPQQRTLVIEVPVARFPLTQYVPALRFLLEHSDRDESAPRLSARGDLVLCRTVLRLSTTTPALVCDAFEATLAVATESARVLVGALQARALSPKEQAALTVDTLPRGVALPEQVPIGDRGASFQTMASAAEPARRPAPAVEPPAARFGNDEMPAVLMPPAGLTPSAAPQQGTSPSARPGLRAAETAADTRAAQAAIATTQVTAHVAPAQPAVHARPTAPPPPAATSSRLAEGPRPGSQASSLPATSKSLSIPPPIDPLGDTFTGALGAAPPALGGPEDELCKLLHVAQTLGAALSFADQPATMLLLVRATVYQAIFDFGTTVPDAIAFLCEETAGLTREIHITAPGVRRGAMAIPSASPAFETMSRIVAARGQVTPVAPLQITPITTSQDAKQHLARYVSEIGQAPSDLDLRHFLALGALTELLVRTKLPGATGDKLRGIVTHARRDGAKPATVELLITALSRMMA